MMQLDYIYKGDCLEFMASLERDSIDLVLTSLPYNFGGFNRDGRESKYDCYADDMPEADYRDWIGKVLAECVRILKPGGSIYWNHKGRFIDGVYYGPFWVIDRCPAQLYQHIIWKFPSSPDVAKIKWYPRQEDIFWFAKGKPAYFNEEMAQLTDIWDISHIQQNEHPAPFPYNLARRAINASCPLGGIVLDPFMGSGTTALAAIDLDRHFLGSEISDKYIAYANERIRNKTSQLSLF